MGAGWSWQVEAADWIRARLAPAEQYAVGSLVPSGYASCVRLLHSAFAGDVGGRPVRWSTVAAWSGLPLHRLARWHSVALPFDEPPSPKPFDYPPQQGSLGSAHAAELARVLRAHTATPERCWFGVWEGWGIVDIAVARPPAGPPRVRLPHREYLLWQGPVEAAGQTVHRPDYPTPQLWWPDDHAWFVAAEIDLNYTYVAGNGALGEALAASEVLEVLPASLDDPLTGVEPWVEEQARWLAEQLRTTGQGELRTGVGRYRARLTRTPLAGPPVFEEVIDRPDGRTTRSRGVLSPTATDAELVRRLAYGLVSVAE